MHGIILRNGMTVQLFVGSSLSSVPVKKRKHLHQLIAFAINFCRWQRYFSTLLFLIFFFHPDGIFFGRHLRYLFAIRFIESTFTTMFTITGITSTVIIFIISFKKGTMMTKGNLFMSLKGNFRCQFVYTLYGVIAKIIFRSCVTRDGANLY